MKNCSWAVNSIHSVINGIEESSTIISSRELLTEYLRTSRSLYYTLTEEDESISIFFPTLAYLMWLYHSG